MTYSFVIVESSPSLEHCTKSVITLIVEWCRVGQRLHYSYKFSFLQRENLLISSDSKAYSIIFYPNLKNIKVETPYNDILSTNGLNTLIFNNPYAKLCFITMLTSQYRKIIYIDLDTTFTAYVKAGLLLENTKNAHKVIKIYLATEGRFESVLRDTIESMSDSSIVIFDSVNSFYNMYYKKIDIESGRGISNLNHLLSIFLMMLLKNGKPLNVPILVTSMIRYKKDNEWIQSPASKRLLQKKSIVKLNVAMMNGEDLSVEILTHPVLASKTIIFRNQGVKL